MVGVTRVNIMKHLNKNKQLEREISELKQQVRLIVYSSLDIEIILCMTVRLQSVRIVNKV